MRRCCSRLAAVASGSARLSGARARGRGLARCHPVWMIFAGWTPASMSSAKGGHGWGQNFFANDLGGAERSWPGGAGASSQNHWGPSQRTRDMWPVVEPRASDCTLVSQLAASRDPGATILVSYLARMPVAGGRQPCPAVLRGRARAAAPARWIRWAERGCACQGRVRLPCTSPPPV